MNTVTWCFSVLILATAQQLTDASYSSADFVNVKLHLYIGSLVNVSAVVNLPDAGSLCDKMDKSKPVAIIICELGSGPSNESMQVIKDGYQKRGDCNYVLVDISALGTNILDVNAFLNALGVELAVYVNLWLKAGLVADNIHCVGYAHGYYVALSLLAKLDVQLGVFIGLDPISAQLGISVALFPSYPNVKHSRCLLTDAGVWAVDSCNCDVIYLLNNGIRLQPGCLLSDVLFSEADSCSHRRAYQYYGESLYSPNLKCRKCSSAIAFATNLCILNEVIYLGLDTSITASGTYYANTNSCSPYGKGDAGC